MFAGLLEKYPRRRILVTPLGGSGFIFGRGNRQFTPDIIRRVGRENIMVVANRDKLAKWIVETIAPRWGPGAPDHPSGHMPIWVEGETNPRWVSGLEFLELMALDLDLFRRRGSPFSFLKATDRRPSKERTDDE